jgi:radical SAM superfamily enzyme YgiQ (UPF0313 family)
MRHLELLKNQYGVRHIHFEDDNLTLNRQRFNRILDNMISQELGITWDTPNGIRADTLTKEIIAKMIASGVIYVTFGIESGCQEVNQKIVKKNLDLRTAEETIRLAWEQGLDTHAFYVVGFPGETRQQIKTTFKFATRLKKHYNVYPRLGIANPLENTEMHSVAQKAGWLVDHVKGGIRFNFGVERRFKRKTIRTDEFDIYYLNRMVRIFNRNIALLTISRSIRFLFKNPSLFNKLIHFAYDMLAKDRRSFSEVIKIIFLRKLLYPYFFKRSAKIG